MGGNDGPDKRRALRLSLIRFFFADCIPAFPVGLFRGEVHFLSGKIKTIYFKYLSAAFGSALITSIYSIVDMAMVGQYHGPEGSAALAVVAPVWNIIYSFGLLMGIGDPSFSALSGEKRAGICGHQTSILRPL